MSCDKNGSKWNCFDFVWVICIISSLRISTINGRIQNNASNNVIAIKTCLFCQGMSK